MITEIQQKSRVGTGSLNLGTVQLWNELFVLAGPVLGLVGCLAVCSLPMRCSSHTPVMDSSHHHTLLDVPWRGGVEFGPS